jgi:hypothetical protein
MFMPTWMRISIATIPFDFAQGRLSTARPALQNRAQEKAGRFGRDDREWVTLTLLNAATIPLHFKNESECFF